MKIPYPCFYFGDPKSTTSERNISSKDLCSLALCLNSSYPQFLWLAACEASSFLVGLSDITSYMLNDAWRAWVLDGMWLGVLKDRFWFGVIVLSLAKSFILLKFVK